LNEFDHLINLRNYGDTTTKTALGGQDRTVDEFATGIQAKYMNETRRQDERTYGGRETSIQQDQFVIRDFPVLRSQISKDTRVYSPQLDKEFDIIAIHRDAGRIGQLLKLVVEIRE
jgi:hypothetical protein